MLPCQYQQLLCKITASESRQSAALSLFTLISLFTLKTFYDPMLQVDYEI